MSGSSILGRETRYSVLRKSHPPRDSRDCTAGASRTIKLSFTFTSEPAFYFPKQPISVVSCCNVSFFANDSSSSNTHTLFDGFLFLLSSHVDNTNNFCRHRDDNRTTFYMPLSLSHTKKRETHTSCRRHNK